MRRFNLALVLAVAVAAACEAKPPVDRGKPEPVSAKAAAAAVPEAEKEAAAVPAPSPEAAQALGRAINGLAADVFSHLPKGQNIAISPASIHVALTMTWAGAVGATEAELAKVLHLDQVDGDPATIVGGQLGVWQRADGLTLRTANRLFGEKHYSFEADYLERTRKAFGAPLEPTDFQGAPEPSRQHINAWVEEQTETRIKNLLPGDAIDSDTRLVLVNAVYFLGEWLDKFEEGSTRDGDFQAPGGTVTVPMMRRVELSDYAETGEGPTRAQVVGLAYKDTNYGMLVVLPEDIAAVEGSLNADTIAGWRDKMARRTVDLTLPRFTIDPESSLSLKDTLGKLGMKLSFTGDADFTKIANPKDRADRLSISDVFHKCFVKVDEKGTEAAAATAVVMGRGAGAGPEPVEMKVDRPFLFFVIDHGSGAVLFMGRVVDPGQGRERG